MKKSIHQTTSSKTLAALQTQAEEVEVSRGSVRLVILGYMNTNTWAISQPRRWGNMNIIPFIAEDSSNEKIGIKSEIHGGGMRERRLGISLALLCLEYVAHMGVGGI